MLTITPQAADQIRRAAQQGGMEGMSLRIAAKRDGDGSIDYMIGFDDLGGEDLEYIVEGIPILISEFSKDLLKGVTLDFVELTPGEYQFIFVPPAQDQRASAREKPQD